MAQSSGYGNNSNMSTTAINADKRTRERLRRQQMERAAESVEELPSFSEPRRIRAERQDSLTNRIQTVLGDMQSVHTFIGRDPNIWLGTSRNASNSAPNNSTAKSQPGERTKSHREATTNMKTVTNNQVHVTRPKQHLTAPNVQRAASTNSLSSSDMGKTNSNEHLQSKPRDDSRTSSSKSNPNSSHANYNTSQQNNTSSHSQSSKYSDSEEHRMSSLSSLTSPNHEMEQVPNRERLQSMDMPVEMESIFRDMQMNDPISEIQTPQIGKEFTFLKTESKSTDSTPKDLHEDITQRLTEAAGNSDSDSSDESDSDGDESDQGQETTDKWYLGSYMTEIQKPEDQILGSGTEDSSKKKSNNHSQQNKNKDTAQKNSNSSSQTSHSRKSSSRGRPSEKTARRSPFVDSKSRSSSAKANNEEKKTVSSRSKSRQGSGQRTSSPADRRNPNSLHSMKKSKSSPYVSHRDANKDTKPNKQAPANSSPLSERNPARGRPSKDSKQMKKGSVVQGRGGTQTIVKSSEAENPKLHPHSINNNSNNAQSVPFSVRNETLPSSKPAAEQHQRTGQKGPSSLLTMKNAGRVAEKKATRYPVSPSRDVSSSSDSSDDEGGGLSSSSSSSDSEMEQEPIQTDLYSRETSRPPDNYWNNSSTRERSNSTSTSKQKNSPLEHETPPTVHEPLKKGTNKRQVGSRTGGRAKNDRRSAPEPLNRHKNTDSKSTVQKKYNDQSKYHDRMDDPKSFYTSYESKAMQQLPAATPKGSKNEMNYTTSKKPKYSSPKLETPRLDAKMKMFPPLWVKMQPNPMKMPAVSTQHDIYHSKVPSQHQRNVSGAEQRSSLENNDFYGKKPSKYDSSCASVSRMPAMSTGSETDQPSRLADFVQVEEAASSCDLSPRGSSSLQKRKHVHPGSNYSYDQSVNTQSNNHKSKRRKRETPSPINHEDMSTNEGPKQIRDENNQWKNWRKEQPNNQYTQQWNHNGEQSGYNNQQQPPSNNQQRPTSNNESCQTSSATAGVASIISEPDSSWPEQERLLKSDQYMREGKRLKHEGDAFTDTRTGRTRAGESLSRALVYFEATLCFIMNGYVLELENGNDRNENAGSSHSPTSMYHQTITLLDYIRKMRPHDEQEEQAFKRLNLSCIRSQALLYLRVYKLKKDVASKYSDTLVEQFKQNVSKSNRTPSPWHAVNGQNVVSPMSPAVPSPYGVIMPGPSPVAGTTNNCELVSSSTQVSKITSPPSQSSIVLQPKVYEMFRHYHSIMSSLMQAHEKWDQAETLQPEHADFFRNVDILCGHPLMLDSSLRDMATYNKVILRQLRAAYTSPQD